MQPGGIAAYGVPGAVASAFGAGLPAVWWSSGTLSAWAIAFLIGFVVFFFIVAAFSAWGAAYR